MSDPDRIRESLEISCADALELMTDHLEGALSAADAERFRGHLAGCQPCSVYLDQLRQTIRISSGEADDAELGVDSERVERLVELFRRERGD